jgi:hypothetical protein
LYIQVILLFLYRYEPILPYYQIKLVFHSVKAFVVLLEKVRIVWSTYLLLVLGNVLVYLPKVSVKATLSDGIVE